VEPHCLEGCADQGREVVEKNIGKSGVHSDDVSSRFSVKCMSCFQGFVHAGGVARHWQSFGGEETERH
jgi:hypothetical protein